MAYTLAMNNSTSLNLCPQYHVITYGDMTTLRDAWIQFIRKLEPLDWFATFTFREPVHPEQANRRLHRFIRTLNEIRFGKRYREKGLGVCLINALEWQKREVLHFHSLIGGGLRDLDRFHWMELWNRDNGFARIYPYDPAGAPGYVSKYVVKGGEIDISLPPWKELEIKGLAPSQLGLGLV
jgi:hypothetical protein